MHVEIEDEAIFRIIEGKVQEDASREASRGDAIFVYSVPAGVPCKNRIRRVQVIFGWLHNAVHCKSFVLDLPI